MTNPAERESLIAFGWDSGEAVTWPLHWHRLDDRQELRDAVQRTVEWALYRWPDGDLRCNACNYALLNVTMRPGHAMRGRHAPDCPIPALGAALLRDWYGA